MLMRVWGSGSSGSSRGIPSLKASGRVQWVAARLAVWLCLRRAWVASQPAPRQAEIFLTFHLPPSPLTHAHSSLLESEDNDIREASLAVAQQLAAEYSALRVVQQVRARRGCGVWGCLPAWGCCRGDAALPDPTAAGTTQRHPLPSGAAALDGTCSQRTALCRPNPNRLLPAPATPQSAAFRAALQALQVRLDTLPREEWATVAGEVATLKSVAEALDREVPPPPPSAAEAARPLPAAVVDDSSTTGVPAAGLQLVAVPAPAATEQPPN